MSTILASVVTLFPLAQAADRAQIGTFGLDLSARKLSVKPGDDFYTYSNGTWVDSFVIPPDRSAYGSFTKLGELSEQRVRDLIEAASKTPAAPGSNAQKVGDFYASFMDQAAIDARGLGPIRRISPGSPRPNRTPISPRSSVRPDSPRLSASTSGRI